MTGNGPHTSPRYQWPIFLVLGIGTFVVYELWWHVAYTRLPDAGFRLSLSRIVMESDGQVPEGDLLLGVKPDSEVYVEIPTSMSWLQYLEHQQPGRRGQLVLEDHNGRRRLVSVTFRRRRLFPKFFYSVASSLAMFVLVVLASRRRRTPGVPLLLLVAGFGFVLTHGMTNMESLLVQPGLFSLFLLVSHSTGPLGLLLFLLYPEPLLRRPTRAILLAFAPQVLLLGYSAWAYWSTYLEPSPAHQRALVLLADYALPVSGMAYGLAAAAALVARFRRATPAQRHQLLWLPYGLVVFATLGLVLAVLKWNAGPYHWIFGGSDYILPLYALLAFAVGLTFLPFRALDVGRVVNRSVVYAVISALVATIYFLSAGLLGFLVTEVLGLSSTVSTTTATILATALFFPLRNVVQRNVDRLFFKHRYQYRQTVREVTAELTTTLELPRLLGALLTRILADLGVHHGSAVLLDGDPPRLRLLRTAGRPHLPRIPDLQGSPVALLRNLRRASPDGWCLGLEDLGLLPAQTRTQARQLFSALQAELLVLLHFRNTVLGFLALGPRTRGRLYTRAELECLRAIAPAASLAVRNARAYTAVQELNRQLSNKQREVMQLQARLRQENIYLRRVARRSAVPDKLVAASPAFQQVVTEAIQAAATDATVLLLGETGTGKDVLARLIHEHSARADRPLISVNCAAIPATLLESELFGHEKGAFTGAVSRKAGTFELAHEGTLFLDEIGDMPLELQAKLLRVLEDGSVLPLGATKPIQVDVRVIAATNRDLEQLIREGRFRQDLYYRLNVIPIRIPPLRERPEDILPLAEAFLERAAKRLGKRIEGLSERATKRLLSYHWPGNVRELANVVERAVILASGPILDEEIQIPDRPQNGQVSPHQRLSNLLDMPFHEAVQEFRRLLVAHALEAEGGNKSRAAQRLGIQRTYLHRLLNRMEP